MCEHTQLQLYVKKPSHLSQKPLQTPSLRGREQMSFRAALEPCFSAHFALQAALVWKLLALPLHPLQVNCLQVDVLESKKYLCTSMVQGPMDLGKQQGNGRLFVVVDAVVDVVVEIDFVVVDVDFVVAEDAAAVAAAVDAVVDDDDDFADVDDLLTFLIDVWLMNKSSMTTQPLAPVPCQPSIRICIKIANFRRKAMTMQLFLFFLVFFQIAQAWRASPRSYSFYLVAFSKAQSTTVLLPSPLFLAFFH